MTAMFRVGFNLDTCYCNDFEQQTNKNEELAFDMLFSERGKGQTAEVLELYIWNRSVKGSSQPLIEESYFWQYNNKKEKKKDAKLVGTLKCLIIYRAAGKTT